MVLVLVLALTLCWYCAGVALLLCGVVLVLCWCCVGVVLVL